VARTPATGMARAAVSVAALIALTVACSGARGLTARPGSGPARPHEAGMRVQLPIDAYELTWLQTAQLDYVAQRLVQMCAARFGVSYPPGLSPDSIAQGVRVQAEVNSRRYGVSDPAAARAYGYDLPSWMTVQPAPLAKLPPAEQLVLTGRVAPATAGPASRPSPTAFGGHDHGQRVPSGGCAGQAVRELSAAGIGGYGQPEPPSAYLVNQINVEGFQRAQSNPRVRAVFARWSACMRWHGYNYPTPLAATGDPHWNLNAPPTRTEIRTAETDVVCKQRTNLLAVTFAVESGYENALIARHARTLAQARSQVVAEAKAIARLLAARGH
jgi:hypothetical protein